MKKRLCFILIGLIGLLPLYLLAQESQIEVQHLSVEEGLSSRWVNSVCQSPEGYIWLATNYGLNRYDGKSFKKYTNASHGLFSDKIIEVKATADDLIWLFYGLSHINQDKQLSRDIVYIDLYDPVTDKVLPFEQYFPENHFDFKKVEGTYLDDNFHLWIWTKNGAVFRYDGKWTLVYQTEQKEKINAITYRKEGGLWLTYGKKILQIDLKEKRKISQDTLPFYPKNICQDAEGLIWLTPWNFGNYTLDRDGSLFYKKEGEEIERVQTADEELEEEVYFGILLDRKGHIWKHKKSSIEIIDTQQGTRGRFQKSIIQSSRASIFTDIIFDQNNLAFISSDDGFFIVNLAPNKFQTYLENQSISTRAILDYSVDSLLVFAYYNTYMVDKESGQSRAIPMLKKYSHYGVVVDQEGILWAGNHTPYVSSIDLNKQETKKYSFRTSKRTPHATLFPYIDKNTNRIWIGTSKGLAYVDKTNQSLAWMEGGVSFPEFSEYAINGFHQNEEGLWLASDNGLYLYREGEGVVAHYDHFPYRSINRIYEDTDHIFWLNTRGGGIIRWDRQTNRVEQFTEEEGLSNNVIYAVIEDDFENLWLPSDYGLMRFNKVDRSIVTYFPSDGIPHEEFNNASFCKGRDSLLYFGGINGITVVNPGKLEFENVPQANVLVTEFTKNDPNTGKIINALSDLRKTGEIVMTPAEKSFSLYFALPYFKDTRQIKYAYKVEGIDLNWLYTSKNFVRINSLPYGKYTLRIKGQGGGQWSSKELAIPLIYAKPFYAKTWFIILAVLSLLALFAALVNWRLRHLRLEKIYLEKEIQKRTTQIEEQNKRLEAMNNTKDQFFGIIAHDLRGPMLSFRGLTDKFQFLIEQKREKEIKQLGQSIEEAYSKLDRLLDNLLNWALVQKGTLPFYPQDLELKNVTQEVLDLFSDQAKAKGINLSNEIIDEARIYADANALSAILRNLINNAIKYSDKGGQIKVATNVNADYFQLEVSDDGRGLHPEQINSLFGNHPGHRKDKTKGGKGTGLGLHLCRELIELHQGEIWIESEPGIGTQVFFTLAFPQTKSTKVLNEQSRS